MTTDKVKQVENLLTAIHQIVANILDVDNPGQFHLEAKFHSGSFEDAKSVQEALLKAGDYHRVFADDDDTRNWVETVNPATTTAIVVWDYQYGEADAS